MKRLLAFATLLIAFSVVNASAGGMGAVRVAFEPDVGWVNFNTTASGKLVATAHLHDGLPNEEFSVSVRVRYEDGATEVFPDIAVLTTNGQGKGDAHIQVETNPPPGSTTLRRVAFRVRRAPNPLYVAVAWDMPLKSSKRTQTRRAY